MRKVIHNPLPALLGGILLLQIIALVHGWRPEPFVPEWQTVAIAEHALPDRHGRATRLQPYRWEQWHIINDRPRYAVNLPDLLNKIGDLGWRYESTLADGTIVITRQKPVARGAWTDLEVRAEYFETNAPAGGQPGGKP